MKYFVKVFLEHFAFGLIIPFSVVWMLQQNMSLTQVGLVQAVVFMSTFLSEVPTGVIADKFGRKNNLVIGALLHTVALFLFLISQSFFGFIVSAICTGVAWALISGAEETYVHDVIAPMSGLPYKKFFARVTISDEASTLIGMLAGSILTIWFSLQSVFIVAVVFMLFTALYLFFFLPQDAADVKLDDVVGENPQDLRVLFQKYRSFIPILIALGILFESARILWQPALLEQGLQVAQLGVVFAALKCFSIVGSFIAERLEIPHKKAIAVSGLAGGIALLGLSASSLWIGITGLAIYFMMENILRVNQSVFLLEIAPNKNKKTTFLSGANLVRNLTSSLASPVLGWGAGSSLRIAILALFGVKLISSYILVRKDPK
jgi:MFS family permease